MKLWIDDKPPPDGSWRWAMVHGVGPTLDMLKAGIPDEISLGGRLGLEVALLTEHGSWKKTIPPVRWSVRVGDPLVEGNAQAAMERAEVYWGIRKVEPELRESRP